MVGTYRVYAAGQSLLSGSNMVIVWDAATETSSGDIDIALEPYPFDPTVDIATVHQAGTYSGVLHVDFGGTVFPADVFAGIGAFDNGIADASTGQYAAGTDPIHMDSSAHGAGYYGFDAEGKVVISTPDGYFGANAGPGSHSATTITTASYLEIYRWAESAARWFVGKVGW